LSFIALNFITKKPKFEAKKSGRKAVSAKSTRRTVQLKSSLKNKNLIRMKQYDYFFTKIK